MKIFPETNPMTVWLGLPWFTHPLPVFSALLCYVPSPLVNNNHMSGSGSCTVYRAGVHLGWIGPFLLLLFHWWKEFSTGKRIPSLQESSIRKGKPGGIDSIHFHPKGYSNGPMYSISSKSLYYSTMFQIFFFYSVPTISHPLSCKIVREWDEVIEYQIIHQPGYILCVI